jgi:4-amino-4-deoxy-L-arabinose transferase-like glycosyltransferase
MKRFIKYLPLAIVLSAFLLRVYQLDKIPPSFSWDEASFGYNAYSIANWGIDEWGEKFPLTFAAFGEYKSPVDIYITALFVKVLGFNDFTVRLPAVVLGTLSVYLVYLLVRVMFKRNDWALFSSLMLAISPYNIQFSRHHHELNIALFFYLLGLLLFFKSIQSKGYWIIVAVLSLITSFFTYNAAKIMVPITAIILVPFYWKELLTQKKFVLISIGIIILFAVLFFANPNLSGSARLKQTLVDSEKIHATVSYKLFKREKLALPEVVVRQYPLHFSPKFLFITGDENPRHSSQIVGEFYAIDALFLIAGVIYSFYLVLKKKSKETLLVLLIALSAIVPSALTDEAPHAARAMFMTGSWHILIGLGIFSFLNAIKSKKLKVAGVIVILSAYMASLGVYYSDYLLSYSTKYSVHWQYGYKKIFEGYKDEFDNYEKVYISDKYAQPYIFALYYLKYNPGSFRESVRYNSSDKWSFSNVASFSNFIFTDKFEKLDGNALIFAPDKLSEDYSYIETINNLDGTNAFWVYSK